MTEAFEDLEKSGQLVESAEEQPTLGRDAAIAELRALLEEWGETPGADTTVGLLEQAAKTDRTLMDFHAEAAVLDRFPDEPDSAERARIFVDAARARLTNI